MSTFTKMCHYIYRVSKKMNDCEIKILGPIKASFAFPYYMGLLYWMSGYV